jgi:hypothetical protein
MAEKRPEAAAAAAAEEDEDEDGEALHGTNSMEVRVALGVSSLVFERLSVREDKPKNE